MSKEPRIKTMSFSGGSFHPDAPTKEQDQVINKLWICMHCFAQYTDNVNPHTKLEWYTSGEPFDPKDHVCPAELKPYISLDDLHKKIGMGLTHWIKLNTTHLATLAKLEKATSALKEIESHGTMCAQLGELVNPTPYEIASTTLEDLEK